MISNRSNMDREFRESRTLIMVMSIMALMILLLPRSYAFGIAPSKEIMQYDTEEHVMQLRIVNNEHQDMDFIMYSQGELGQYVKFAQTKIHVSSSESEKTFSYSFRLPAQLSPGPKNIQIAVVEVPDMQQEDSKTSVYSSLVVIHELEVDVPYDGLYAEGYLHVDEANVNGTVQFSVNLVNKGTQAIGSASGEIIIKGPTNEEMARIDVGTANGIASKGSAVLAGSWLANVNAGVYYVEFVVNYDSKQLVLRKTFMVGSSEVEIRNAQVKNFKIGSIARFDIDVVNQWNEPIDNVYGELNVLDETGKSISSTKTAPVTLSPLVSARLEGYWDTSDVKIGKYSIDITLNYAGKRSHKLFNAIVGMDDISIVGDGVSGNLVSKTASMGSNGIWIALIVLLVIINIGWLIYFKSMKRRDE